ncbi:MAG: methyltransferase domain-containing protein [Acetobacteraceae bacterium]|nr:methyltransferase domain-containing protein [Acetobacteraceae bacterium]
MMVEAARHAYDDGFFDYIERGSRRSAQHIVAILRHDLAVSSVLDVGCGRGVWVEEWRRNGVLDAIGVDGDYVNPDRLIIPKENFIVRKLAQKFSLGRRFDVVQSLEVAEHIPGTSADCFIDSLVGHGPVILFSAAVPGQGGEFHVNEQPYEYWRKKFADHHFDIFDFLRPNIIGNRAIEPWYRYNTFLFVQQSAVDRLPEAIRKTRLQPNQPVAELAPLPWRLRNFTLRQLPQPVVQRIARLKHAIYRAGISPN